MKHFIAYVRVSTTRQGESGLGLEAQRAAIERHVTHSDGKVLEWYQEVESGRKCNRVELAKALAHAKRTKATLIIGKLDRLSRNAAFLMNLLDAKVEIVAADNPQVDRLTLQILAVLAEDESRRISKRTTEALQAAKRRGQKLGSARPGCWDGREHLRLAALERARQIAYKINKENLRQAYEDILPLIQEKRADGMTFAEIAEYLSSIGHMSRRGKKLTHLTVYRIYSRCQIT